jgi:hypothetical protein
MTVTLTLETVIALSAYLRRLELSIDRSLREDAAPLRAYIEREVRPPLPVVVEWAMGFGGIHAASIRATKFLGPSLLFGRMQMWVRGTVGLDPEQISRIGVMLQELSQALLAADFVDPSVFAPIRLDLRRASDALLRYVPHARTRRRIQRIEHRNQNPVIETEEFTALVGEAKWLTPHDGQRV